MRYNNYLIEYLRKHGVTSALMISDGALVNSIRFPVAALETHGAILFADLPEYSKRASEMSPIECAYMVNHFFAWFEGEAGRQFGGIIDKFIGDEVMIVFPNNGCKCPPLVAAMHTAKAMLDNDPWSFAPRIGIAQGEFAIAMIGAERSLSASAMGNVVNLAARCAACVEYQRSVRVATSDVDAIKEIFADVNRWEVSSIKTFTPKNMDSVDVIDVRSKIIQGPILEVSQDGSAEVLNYRRQMKEDIERARGCGAIQTGN